MCDHASRRALLASLFPVPTARLHSVGTGYRGVQPLASQRPWTSARTGHAFHKLQGHLHAPGTQQPPFVRHGAQGPETSGAGLPLKPPPPHSNFQFRSCRSNRSTLQSLQLLQPLLPLQPLHAPIAPTAPTAPAAPIAPTGPFQLQLPLQRATVMQPPPPAPPTAFPTGFHKRLPHFPVACSPFKRRPAPEISKWDCVRDVGTRQVDLHPVLPAPAPAR